ncbi:multiple epidermal growth factor-like domains protein 10 isoform X2 [Saccostrea cucullata]|uniref:multiple epidermal growth factor-like domains protein 10 isoform X2 n=1 Tax=Saccostrea cuccullata TaxID=36930 RepID=UPI002ED4BC36
MICTLAINEPCLQYKKRRQVNMVIDIVLIFLLVSCTKSYENLALNKPAWQQSDWPDKPVEWGAAKAVDGQYTDRSVGGNQCTESGPSQSTAEWRVDLQSVASISYINIFYRTDNTPSPGTYYNRFAGFFVYVSNTTRRQDGHLCFHELQQVNGTPTENQTISCPVHGRYVIYYNERGRQGVTYPSYYSRYAYNELCELEVIGCSDPRFYGENCNQPCSENCQEQRCNITTGECLGCVPGYQGPMCNQVCDNQRYGLECSFICGNCIDGVTCNHVNGTCLNGCDVGVEGEKCQAECTAGFYGKNCGQRCSENCFVTNRCDRFTGECKEKCKPGWQTLRCTQKCEGGTYGVDCRQICGHCLNGEYCHHLNGTCGEGCSVGFHGATCVTECSAGYFGINCQENCKAYCGGNKTCDVITGVCDEGCKEGLQGPLCGEGSIFRRTVSNSCESTITSIIISIVISLLLVLSGSILNFIIWKRRNDGTEKQNSSRTKMKNMDATGRTVTDPVIQN